MATIVLGAGIAFPAAASASTAPAPLSLTSSSCPTNIVEGELDGCVTELQDLLNVHGAGLSVDGDFGANTLTAVKNFQSAHGLGVDGQVGPQTKAALYAAAAPAPISLTSSSCPTEIVQGELDGCVTELQQLLNQHGANIVADGDFGPNTLAAVRTFQSAHGLAVDGIVGPNTKAALMGGSSSVPAPIALTSSACPADIQEGLISGCVTELQQLLNQHGAALGVDGDFGADTLAAVKDFQSAHGLEVDGVVGPNTKAALDAGSGTVPAAILITSSSCPANIVQGEDDGCVTDLQELLNQNGANVSVDGDFGPNTLAAVENYQSTHGLGVDGQVGPQTKAALTGNAAPTGNPPPPSAATLTAIVNYATAIENGHAETGWAGGHLPYGYDGGHGATPGPSPADCAADGGDPACWTATQNGTPGYNGEISVDCSGFARWVYALAYGHDVLGASGTDVQISEMTRVSSPVPGDLVFFGSSSTNTHHVGVYIGNGKMINAYDTGTYIQTNNVSDGGTVVGYYQYGSGSTTPAGQSTNADWAKHVLADGGWPQSTNNVTVIMQWMSSEEPPSDWWDRNNPLNNGYGSGGGAGLGSYNNLITAADFAAQNLQQGTSDYGHIVADLASSAAPATTAQAIIDSPWSCGHYSGSTTCNTSGNPPWGAAFNHGSVATVAAPASAW